jgi:predicted site-specific integrase-resolvase
MIVTMGVASRMTGKSKTTLLRYYRSGKISAVRNQNGSYEFDTSELARVFDVTPITPVTESVTGNMLSSDTPQKLPQEVTDTALQVRVAVAEQSLKHLQEMLDMVKEQRDQIAKDRDHWQQTATNSQQLLLSYQGKTGSIFKRLFG